jgi:hypothetical protein
MEDKEHLNGTVFAGTFVIADGEESRFIRLVNSVRKQGAENLREPHRVHSRFLRCSALRLRDLVATEKKGHSASVRSSAFYPLYI